MLLILSLLLMLQCFCYIIMSMAMLVILLRSLIFFPLHVGVKIPLNLLFTVILCDFSKDLVDRLVGFHNAVLTAVWLFLMIMICGLCQICRKRKQCRRQQNESCNEFNQMIVQFVGIALFLIKVRNF